MTWFEDLVLTQGSGWAAALGDVAVRSTVLLAVAGVLALLLRNRAATVRHRVWMLALAGVLILPVVGAIVPGLPLSVPLPYLMAPSFGATDRQIRSEVGRPSGARPPLAQGGETVIGVEHGSNRATLASQPSSMVTPGEAEVALSDTASAVAGRDRTHQETGLSAVWPRWVLAVWAIGAALPLGRLAVGRFLRRRLGRAAHPVTDPGRLAMFDQIVAELGIRRPVQLLESHRLSVPVTWGCWQAVVAVPTTSETWSEDRWRVVLRHELTHVRRGDCLSQLVSQLACVVHWFNPLAWFGANSLRLEGERACDEEVIRAGTRASDYAQHLLEIAQTCQPRDWTASATVGMARRTQLEGRLLNILEPPRAPATSRRLRAAASAVVGASILAVAAVQPAATTASGQTAPPEEERGVVNTVSVLSPAHVDEVRAARPSPTDAVAAYATAVAVAEPAVAELRRRAHVETPVDRVVRPTPTQQTPTVGSSSPEEVGAAYQEAWRWAQDAWDGSFGDQAWDDVEADQNFYVDHNLYVEGGQNIYVDDDLYFHLAGPGEVYFGGQGEVTPLTDRVITAFIDALDDSQAAVRRSAVVALGRHRVERAAEPLAAVLSDADAGLREEAVRALGRIRSPAAVAGLVTALRDDERAVRAAAAQALGSIRDAGAVDGLIGALDDADQRVARYAIRALARIDDERGRGAG